VTTQRTLLALLSGRIDRQVLKFYEKALDFKADATVWAMLVHNASVKLDAAATVAVYSAALFNGIRPTNSMLHPVLRALCSGSLRPPSEASIDRAIRLYRDFIKANTVVESVPVDGDASGAAQHQAEGFPSTDGVTTPDTAIYNTLLRSLASSSNIKKYFPIALSLFEDLRSRGVATDAMTSTSLIVLLMRTSPTYEEAFRVYRTFAHSKDGKLRLDGEGYIVVLNTFCNRVSVSATRIPPAHLFFEIIKDMRAAGHPVSAKVYTLILQRLAILATRTHIDVPTEDRPAELALLAEQIKRVHEALLLDTLAPDTALWNQLMDTYQRAQCFEDAMSVWETLYRSSRLDNASVSVVLDACSYADAYGIATKIWARLTESHFPLNLHNWKTWLECLCRMGKIEEASKLLCLEMGKGEGGYGIAPDIECARIILSFASNKTEEGVILMRIKQYQPRIWGKL